MTIAVVITTYNEEASIHALVRAFVAQQLPVIVVDDASTDCTVQRAYAAGARLVFRTEGKWGIGPSLMHGWKLALDMPDVESVLQIDAGGSHQPEDFPDMCEALVAHRADMVIGSRFCTGAHYLGVNGPWWRPWASKLAAMMCNYAQSGAHYTDWTSGYRLFTRDVLEYLLTKRMYGKMHGWQMEVLAHAGARGFRIVEVPITYIAAQSSFNRRVAHEAIDIWLHILNHVGWVGVDAP